MEEVGEKALSDMGVGVRVVSNGGVWGREKHLMGGG